MHEKKFTEGFEENSADLSSLGEERNKRKEERKIETKNKGVACYFIILT